jgi:phage gp46-like protein|tara:strand:+ start:352 stop:534 length:183 start_codon:yes stop_codon:yes gene_type:complete
MEILTLEIGNSSWWKDKKYRKEAVRRLRELRSKKLLIKLIKKYRLDTSSTIVYGDYLIKK